MAFFKKAHSRTTHQSPQRAAPPPSPPEPPSRVKYDRREKRKYVRDIIDIRGPHDGRIEVLLASTGKWQTLTKAQIDVKAVLSDLRYGANYFGKSWFDETPTYGRFLIGRVTLRGFDSRSPLIAFPPYKNVDDVEQPWGLYTASFGDVSIFPHTETYPVSKEAYPCVQLWADFDEFDAYVRQLSDVYQAAKKSGESITTLWPNCILNTRHSIFKRDLDKASARSGIHLPKVVFDGLTADMVSMGPKLSVYIQVAVEAYCAGWGQNYGYGEWDDHKYNYDLALVPHGCILTAEIDRMRVEWKTDGKSTDYEYDTYTDHKETYLDNPEPKYEGDE